MLSNCTIIISIINNHWSIYPSPFNILIHIPRIIYQQSPPLFFTFTRYIRVQRGFVTRWSAGQLELKQGLSSGLPSSFALASCTHSVRIVLENESLSLPLSLFLPTLHEIGPICVCQVCSIRRFSFLLPFFLFFFFQINFKPSTEGWTTNRYVNARGKEDCWRKGLKEGIRYVSFLIRGVWSCLLASLGWNVYQGKRKCLFERKGEIV